MQSNAPFTDFCVFLRTKVGPNWVLARRTSRILAKYGESVVCLSPKRYRALEAEFNAQLPNPEGEAVRAMLVALKKISKAAPQDEPGDEEWNDMEHAWNCGHTQAQFEAACIARAAIAQAEAAGIKGE